MTQKDQMRVKRNLSRLRIAHRELFEVIKRLGKVNSSIGLMQDYKTLIEIHNRLGNLITLQDIKEGGEQ